MKKAARFLFVVLIVFVGIFFLLFYFYYAQNKPFRSPEKPNVEVSQANIVELREGTRLIDIQEKSVPFNIYYDELEGIVVSGVIQEANIEKNGSLLIAVPDINDTLKRSILVWTYIGSADRPIMLLKLAGSKFGPEESWNLNNNLAELSALLQPGRQVIVHIKEADSSKAEKLIQEGKSNYFVELAPIVRIIIGI